MKRFSTLSKVLHQLDPQARVIRTAKHGVLYRLGNGGTILIPGSCGDESGIRNCLAEIRRKLRVV